MRRLIWIVALTLLWTGEAHAASGLSGFCDPYMVKWLDLSTSTNIGALTTFAAGAPTTCPAHTLALHRIEELKRERAKPAATPPQPKVKPPAAPPAVERPGPTPAPPPAPAVNLPPMPTTLSPPVVWTPPAPEPAPPAPAAPVAAAPAPTPIVAPPPSPSQPPLTPIAATPTMSAPIPIAPPPQPAPKPAPAPQPAAPPAVVTPTPVLPAPALPAPVAPAPVAVTPAPEPAPKPAPPVVAAPPPKIVPAPAPAPPPAPVPAAVVAAPAPPPPPQPAPPPAPVAIVLPTVGPFKTPAAKLAQAAKDEATGEDAAKAKNLPWAEAYLQRAQDEGLDNSANHYWLGRVAYDQHKPRTAIQEYGKALDAAPDDSAGDQRRALLDRAKAENNVEQYPAALQDLARYKQLADQAKAEPGYAYYYYSGRTDLALGDNAGAVASFGEALKLQPDDQASFFGQGVADARLNNLGNASSELKEAEQLETTSNTLDFQTFYYIAIVQLLQGDKESAANTLTTALRYDTDGSMASTVQCLSDDAHLPSFLMSGLRLGVACKNIDAKHEVARPVQWPAD